MLTDDDLVVRLRKAAMNLPLDVGRFTTNKDLAELLAEASNKILELRKVSTRDI